MRKNLLLLCIAAFGSVLLRAQTLPATAEELSGTGAPAAEWDEWFNKAVEKYIENHKGERTTITNYRIPVVFHVIHFGQTIGTFPNIDSNQIKSQIAILNADYAGTGLNYTNVPTPFANLIANTGISFCLARRDPTGALLTERGIHRVNANSNGWPNPATATVNLVNYINNTVKAATIWDPTKYLNIWISDRSATTTVLGFATYPAGTTITGIPPGVGTSTNDGVWCWTKAVGNVGTTQAPWNKGRTLTREIAHWLGVRSLWGDGNCLTDYCSDTPWAKQGNTGCPGYPSYVNRCGINQSPYGEMTMNFLDMTDDACRYMFTPQQAVRMQAAMSQCNFRNLLGTHNLCSPLLTSTASAVANFSITDQPCVGRPFTPMNNSTGFPWPTFQWSSAPSSNIFPAPSVANPAITFNSPGTYTLYLTATNSLNISSYSMVVTSVTTCPTEPLCIDSIRIIQNTDTLTTYKAVNNASITGCQTGFAGYLTGTNCYKDKEFAQFIPASAYSAIQMPQVNSVIVLFDSIGTRATAGTLATQIACKLYSGNATSGPNTQLVSKTDSLGKIASSPKTKTITYLGTPTYTFTTTKVIPFRFDFASPVDLTGNTPGFFIAVEAPNQSPGDSIRIFSNTITSASNDSSSWILLNNINNWRTLRYNRNAKVQLAMIPQITCRPIVGIDEKSLFGSNIAVVPNPNNGVFDLVFTLPHEQKLSITTYNALGQKVAADKLENVGHNMVTMNLNQQRSGIYFIEISNGTERVVKKVVVTH